MKNELASGFYTMKEAAALIAMDVVGVTTPSLRRMFSTTKRYEAAVCSPNAIEGKIRDLGFLDLIELRFISHFRNKGVSSQAIRAAAQSARETFGEHPFARRDITYKTDGRKLFADAASKSGDQRLMELVDRQYEFDLIEEFLLSGLEWSAEKYAEKWRPREHAHPNVVVDPRVSFGQPSLDGRGLAVRTLYEAWIAEGGDTEAVADWFEIPAEEVNAAIRFHDELPN